MGIKLWIVSFLLVILLPGCSLRPEPAPGKAVWIQEGFETSVVDGYWLYLPRNYTKDRTWPLVLFLTGGEGGPTPDPKTALGDGPMKYALAEIPSSPLRVPLASDSLIIINAHMRVGPREKRQWYQYPESLRQALDQVVAQWQGDPQRIYLTGLSRGATGAWKLAQQNPDYFAALVVVAGAIELDAPAKDYSLPTWVVHNTGDPAIPFAQAAQTVLALEQQGVAWTKTQEIPKQAPPSRAIFTALPSPEHGGWEQTYRSPAVYRWLLSQRRQ